jgi:hypothetical protein
MGMEHPAGQALGRGLVVLAAQDDRGKRGGPSSSGSRSEWLIGYQRRCSLTWLASAIKPLVWHYVVPKKVTNGIGID